MVGDVTDKCHDLTVDKNRHGIVDIGQVGAARRVRVVGHKDIAFVDVIAEFLQHTFHQTTIDAM